MAPRTKTGATNARTAKTSDSPAAKPQEQAAQAPAQPAQVKPASDPTPAGANTLGKVLPETAPAPKSTLQKIKDRLAADWQEAARQKAARNAGKTQAQINRESMAELIDMAPIGGRLGGGLRGGAKPNAPRNTPASPAPAPAPKPTTTPAPAPPPANATPTTANGKDGGFSLGRSRNEKGKCGEWLAKQDLHNQGYTDVMEVQNKSGHGVDVIGRNANGDVKVYEVKTTDGTSAPPLSKQQQNMGGKDFTDDRLGKAAGAQGHYKNSPEAKANALKAQKWLETAANEGKKREYKKYEMFIEDPKEGCIKKKAQEQAWDKPTSSSQPTGSKGGRRK